MTYGRREVRVCSRSHGQPPSALRRAMRERRETKRVPAASAMGQSWSRTGIIHKRYSRVAGYLLRRALGSTPGVASPALVTSFGCRDRILRGNHPDPEDACSSDLRRTFVALDWAARLLIESPSIRNYLITFI